MSPSPFTTLLAAAASAPLLFSTGASAQNATSRAHIAMDVLQTWYNGTSGIWDTCGWWNGANCLTTLTDLAIADESVNDAVVGVLGNTFNVATISNPIPERSGNQFYNITNETQAGSPNAYQWMDGSYDDDAWWALAWIAAYDLTDDDEYLDLAVGIFDRLSNTWPSKCGNGGIDSDYSHVYVNAVTNELFFSVAAHLANRASDSQYYVDWARRQWNWFNSSGMINENYTVNDGLTNDCANNADTVWTYNQGVIIGGLAELHRSVSNSSNSSYLDIAEKIAKAAINELADDDYVIRESCEPDCDANATQFKGIFIRNLKLLHSIAPQDEYEKVIRACADSIWDNDRDERNRFGINWAGPVTAIDASTHSSAMDALVAAIDEE